MFETVLKTSCEIIEFGWSKDRAPVDTFILGLATSIRGRNEYDEEVNCTACLLRHMPYVTRAELGQLACPCFLPVILK